MGRSEANSSALIKGLLTTLVDEPRTENELVKTMQEKQLVRSSGDVFVALRSLLSRHFVAVQDDHYSLTARGYFRAKLVQLRDDRELNE